MSIPNPTAITGASKTPVTVLKFGSSVLRSEDHIPAIVNEIYRFVRRGERVVAVVSAIGNTTEELLDQANRFAPRINAAGVATLLSTGETVSSALVDLALDRAGLRSIALDARRLELRTVGPRLDAEPASINSTALQRALEEHQVVVVPGFVGIHSDEQPSLLGRGGSDLTALFIAREINAHRCRLVKDVDGLYEHDPNAAGELPRRFQCITIESARQLDADIVQPKAIEFAGDAAITFEVGCIGTTAPTTVGTDTDERDRLPNAPAPLRVALVGCGTVGYGVYEQLISQPERFQITGVAVQRRARHLGRGVPDHLLTDNPWELVEQGCDVLVELIGGEEPARALIEAALESGADVVTANKDVIAEHGASLRNIAAANNAQLLYSASVGGALPAIETVRDLKERQDVREIAGVLNGTCNYVIDEIRNGASFEDAVRAARRAGFAEADPSADLNGIDTAHKLSILIHEAFGQHISARDIPCQGIDQHRAPDIQASHRAGSVLRLVGTARRNDDGTISASVKPVYIDQHHRLARIEGEENSFAVTTDQLQVTTVCGRGAGRCPTATSVFADLDDVHRRRRAVNRSTQSNHANQNWTTDAHAQQQTLEVLS